MPLLDRLRDAVPGVVTDPDLLASYSSDWTGRWTATPLAVVRPRTAAEVAAVVAECRSTGVPVTVRGGNTGLVGGAVPAEGAVLLSTEALRAEDAPDPGRGTVAVGAGVVLSRLQDIARSAGLEAGLDLASRASATVGGVTATNAGGARVLRHGTARARVAGLRFVDGTGRVVDRLHQLPKDNTGYDLVSLVAGSEGTLGVITDVAWRLAPAPTARVFVVAGFADTATAVAAVPVLRALPGLDALEWARGAGVAEVSAHTDTPLPFAASGTWVFAEVVAAGGTADDLLDGIADTIAELPTERVAVATSASDRERLWRLREGHTETINALGVPTKLDVAVPLAGLAEFVDALPEVVERAVPGARPFLFGHLAEANVHVNIVPPEGLHLLPEADAHRLEAAVLADVLDRSGTISAEHGVGRAKRGWLEAQRGAAQVEVFRGIKRALDPDGVLNPGVLLP